MERGKFTFEVRLAKGIYPGILPDVGAIAAVFAQLHVVAVFVFRRLEDKNELMLAAIQRSLAAGIFYPDAQAFELRKDSLGGRKHLFGMTPVHEDIVKGPGKAVT